jgi:hypothetical protein
MPIIPFPSRPRLARRMPDSYVTGGQLWNIVGSFQSPVIQDDDHLLVISVLPPGSML